VARLRPARFPLRRCCGGRRNRQDGGCDREHEQLQGVRISLRNLDSFRLKRSMAAARRDGSTDVNAPGRQTARRTRTSSASVIANATMGGSVTEHPRRPTRPLMGQPGGGIFERVARGMYVPPRERAHVARTAGRSPSSRTLAGRGRTTFDRSLLPTRNRTTVTTPRTNSSGSKASASSRTPKGS
jgi:hypothetical protein